jgi:hypothetical protein
VLEYLFQLTKGRNGKDASHLLGLHQLSMIFVNGPLMIRYILVFPFTRVTGSEPVCGGPAEKVFEKRESVRMTQGWWAWLKPLSPAVLCLFFSSVQPWGWRAGVVLGTLGILAMIMGVRHLYERERARFRIREAETSLTLLDRKRHDWMNHVQVIMGYLSMKQSDRIRPYLERLVQQAQYERRLSQVNHPPLAVALVALPHRFPEWDWEVEIGEGFQSIPPAEGERIRQMVEEAAEEMGRMTPPDDRATVRFRFDKGENGVIFSVNVSKARQVIRKNEWERLKKRIEARQGRFQIFDGGFMVEIPLDAGKSPGNRLLSWGR